MSQQDTLSDRQLEGKVALVTGASRGIGEAIARALAARGATVVLSSRVQETLDEVAGSINSAGAGRAIAIACNTGDLAAIRTLFDRLDAETGRIDILVNNAGTNPYFGPVAEVPEEAYDKTFDVNLKGPFVSSQLAAQRMLVQGDGGSIINIASVAAVKPAAMAVPYSMTKAALVALTKGMAREVGAAGIRVNAIAPGLIETHLAAALIENPKFHDSWIAATPLGRHGQPEEIVGAALYLASEASSFTTGTLIVCDGGATA